MRISDWSSDVCSSDLIALVIGQLLRPVTTILTQRHLFRHPVDLLLTLPEIEGPGIFEGLVLLGSLKKRHEGYSRQNRRSEEHTSELQSLMRISYAVFCLKKKKQILPQHTNHQEHRI